MVNPWFSRWVLIGVTVLTAFVSFTEHAYPDYWYVDVWREKYERQIPFSQSWLGAGGDPANPNSTGCALCHATANGGSSWNKYGWDIRNSKSGDMPSRLETVRTEQSVHSTQLSSVTYWDEISRGTQPGWGYYNTIYYSDKPPSSGSRPNSVTGVIDRQWLCYHYTGAEDQLWRRGERRLQGVLPQRNSGTVVGKPRDQLQS
jgi:hypothetical protein